MPAQLPRPSSGHRLTPLRHLLSQNQRWAAEITRRDPEFFQILSRQQTPEYLWIGCSDSRVPANEIIGLLPGEVFVHRNIANVVVHADLNCLSVLQSAIDVFKVKHVMVVGHYGCGGVRATMRCDRVGLADNWLRHVQDVKSKHEACLCALPDEDSRVHRLCELNVVEQAQNVCQTTIVRDAWDHGQSLLVHGWVYDLKDGILRDLKVPAFSALESKAAYRAALSELCALARAALDEFTGLRVLGPASGQPRAGMVSFAFNDIHAHDVITVADQQGVALRGGHHCNMPLMKKLGLPSTARASFYLYNTEQDVAAFAASLRKVVKFFR